VAAGDLEVTLRLTGSTAALNSATLTAPQMRGGRGQSLGGPSGPSTDAGRIRGGSGTSGGMRISAASSVNFASSSRGAGGAMSMGGLTLVKLAEPGVWVKPGDVVAEFDRETMVTRLEQFQATVAQNRASMRNIQAQIEVLRQTHEQGIEQSNANLRKTQLDLKTTEVLSQINAERLRLSAEEAKAAHKLLLTEVPLMETSLAAQWRAAQLAQAEAEAELKRIEANLDRLVIRAPITGMVVMQTTMRGAQMAQIKAGDQVGPGQPFMQIVDTSSMLVKATVNQVDAEKIRIGAKATIRLDGYPDLVLPGEVNGIGAMSRAVMRLTDYVSEVPVVVRLLRTDPRVLPDLSASVDVVVTREADTLMTPRESVFRDAPDGPPYVFVRQGDGWLRRTVELGPANNILTAVRSGVKAGDVVARERPPARTAGGKK